MLRKSAFVIALLFSVVARADNTLYLDENIAYCYSELSISRYVIMAEMMDVDGLNRLALSGQCDFVGKGERIKISHYRSVDMDDRSLVAFKKNGKTLWTIKSLTTTVQ